MRLAVISHSAVHLRQQAFYRSLAGPDLEVLAIAPSQWAEHHARSTAAQNHYALCALPAQGRSMNDFSLPARQVLRDFRPDWVYCQNEPFHQVAHDSSRWAREVGARLALFTWENNDWLVTPATREALRAAQLVVCGNSEARMQVEPHTDARVALDLQVGVEPSLFPFWPYDDSRRTRDMLFVSRLYDPMKGASAVRELRSLLPARSLLLPHERGRLHYGMMNALYLSARLSLTPSIEIPGRPREQGPAYTNLEAMFSGTPVLTTSTASVDEWLHGAPAHILDLEDFQSAEPPYDARGSVLASAADSMLEDASLCSTLAKNARQWVEARFSNEAVAERLVHHLEGSA